VNVATKTIVAEGRKKEVGKMTFEIGTAKYVRYSTPENMEVGDRVALKYFEKDGRNIATFVVTLPRYAHKGEKGPTKQTGNNTPLAPEKRDGN
jgi:hypothetical protein